MDGVWVSNHGGRQVDGAIASLLTLEKIAKVCRNWSGGEKTVIFDSGVRTGADVMKALGESKRIRARGETDFLLLRTPFILFFCQLLELTLSELEDLGLGV